MKTLNLLVDSMNKEEIRHLKIFLKRTNANGERKDVKLFDYVKKSGSKFSDAAVQNQLYGPTGRNAYYRLKNRLIEDIGKSLALQYNSQTDANQVLHYISLSRHFQIKQLYDLAFHYLRKAERRATQGMNYELLDLIYSDFIKLSHDSLTVNPEEYIRKREEISTKLQRLRQIDDVLAAVIYRIKVSANYSGQDRSVLDLLEQTVEDFSNDPEVRESPVLRFKIYHAVSRILLQQHDYKALEDYLQSTWKEFTGEGLFRKSNHETKLQMLVYLANSLFKNNKLEEALQVSSQLKEAMEEWGGFLSDKYLVYYYNTQVYCYSILNRDKALEILEEAGTNPVIAKAPLYSAIFKGQQAQILFDQRKFRAANRSIIRMKLDDGFESLDHGFQLQVRVAELIVRFELEDSDFIESQVDLINKDFKDLLTDESYQRQASMLSILGKMIYHRNIRHDETLKAEVDALLASASREEAKDLDWINYTEWLESKS